MQPGDGLVVVLLYMRSESGSAISTVHPLSESEGTCPHKSECHKIFLSYSAFYNVTCRHSEARALSVTHIECPVYGNSVLGARSKVPAPSGEDSRRVFITAIGIRFVESQGPRCTVRIDLQLLIYKPLLFSFLLVYT